MNLTTRASFVGHFYKYNTPTHYLNRTSLLRNYRIATSVFFFIAGLTFSTWASRIPDIQNKLHLSDAGLGAVLFSLPVGLMVSLPISGWLVSRFGSRPMMISGAVLYPLILIQLAASAAVWQLCVALFLFGMLGNLINIAMNTQAVGVETLYGRSVMASFHGLWSLAGFSGAVIGAFFVSQGFSPIMHFSIVCTLSIFLVLITYKSALRRDPGKGKVQKLFAKPDSKILLLGIIAFCSLLCEGAMADWSGVYFKKVVEAPVSMITLGYVAFTSTMALGRFLGDWLVTKTGVKRMLQISGVMITSGLLISVAFPYLITATIGFLLVGFGVSSVVPIVYGIAGKSGTMSPGAALAAVSTIGFLGFLIGPPLIGFVAQAVGLRLAFTIVGVLGFGTALLAARLKFNTSEPEVPARELSNTMISATKNEAVFDNFKPQKVFKNGYVAWPESMQPSENNINSSIIVGRTKGGGFVAYPKKNS